MNHGKLIYRDIPNMFNLKPRYPIDRTTTLLLIPLLLGSSPPLQSLQTFLTVAHLPRMNVKVACSSRGHIHVS